MAVSCWASWQELHRLDPLLTDLQVLVYEETEYNSLTEDMVTAAQVLNSFLQPKLLTPYDNQISATENLYKKLTPEVVELFLK